MPSPLHGSDPYHGMNQMTVPRVPQSYGHWSVVMGADMMGHQDFTRHSGARNAPGYSEDTRVAMQPHVMNQNYGQHFTRQPAAGQRSPSPYSPPSDHHTPGMMQHRSAASESFPPSGDIEIIRKYGGVSSTSKHSGEMASQTSGPQERFMPAMGTAANNKSSPFSSGDLSAHPGQKPVQETLDAAPYGMYGDAARLVGAKQDQDFGGGIGSANVMMSRENDLGAQKPGINLQNLSGIEDVGAQERVRALQEKLLKAEQERDESKRSMERSNAVLNNRIRRLEEQLNVTSAGNEVS